jgi:biotin carboxylase
MGQIRILFLGGAYHQVPIIKEAKRRGWYVITCDYLPDNPGHKLADEYFNVSTTDFEGVLSLAKKVKPDFIVAYASDPAAPIAAYVNEKLGLPGNSYQSVRILGEKDLFRAFLNKNGFNIPQYICISENDNFIKKISKLHCPLIVKPTDSSGSKGVKRIDTLEQIKKAIEYAMQFSRKGKVIVEEFIDKEKGDIHGDGFVVDNELVFSCLGHHLYNSKTNPYNPIGTLWPSTLSNESGRKINKDIAEIIRLSGFKNGPINIEVRINREGKIYIMEIGPRNGGHFVPQAIQYATSFNMVKASLDVLNGYIPYIPDNGVHPTAYYALHTDSYGILNKIHISNQLKPFIKEFHQYIRSGERVRAFQGSNAAIGIILMLFSSWKEMKYYLANIDKFIYLEIENATERIDDNRWIF